MSNEHTKWRQQQLSILLRVQRSISQRDTTYLWKSFHDVFSLEEDERGETDIIEFEINTGDKLPRKQTVRRIPYAAHQEVAEQLERMQWTGVIIPSSSP